MPWNVQLLGAVTVAAGLGAVGGYQWARHATLEKMQTVQEKLAGKLSESERKLAKSRLATENAILKLTPQRPFKKNLAGYTAAQREEVTRHARAAITSLPADADEFDRIAAVTAYVHQLLAPKPTEDGRGCDVLAKGGSNCGGFTVCAGELLAALDMEADFVFLRGGSLGGHTMMQAFLADGRGVLVDPYFGVLYLDSQSGNPLSVADVERGENVTPYHAVFKHTQDEAAIIPYVRLSEAFSPSAPPSSPAYKFPDLFTQADGVYEANSGVRDFIQIPLHPGVTLGQPAWEPSPEEPAPWSALQNWRQSSGQWISWAFTLGSMPMGNRVAHTYSLTELVPGQKYRISMHVAVAGRMLSSPVAAPVFTLQQVAPWGARHVRQFLESRFDSEKPYEPQIMEVDFVAVAPEMSFVGAASGYFLLSCIMLENR